MPEARDMVRVTARLKPINPRCTEGFLGELPIELGLERGSWIGWGHQPGFWHCGVLAKGLAVEALARKHGAGVIHLLADQDEGELAAVDYPHLEDGRWERRCHHFLPAAEGRVAAAQAAARPRSIPDGLADEVLATLARIHAALERATAATDAANQVSRAAFELSAPWQATPERVVAASELLRTATGLRLLNRMCSEPFRCASAFNAALELDRGVARPLYLSAEAQRTELPVWLLNAAGARVRVNAAECRRALDSGQRLLPRAFLATGLIRAATNGFVHGLGGERYELVGNRFWQDWLGVALPPPSVVTADVPLSAEPIPKAPTQPRELRFDPWRTDGDNQPSTELQALRQAIEDTPRGSSERQTAYELLRRAIASQRQCIAERLERVEADWSQWQQRCAATKTLTARDWPFPLHPAASIDHLKSEVQALVGADSGASGSGR